MTSHPSTDSLTSLVLHDTSPRADKDAEQSSSVPSPDIEEALIAAADALLTNQACPSSPLATDHSRVVHRTPQLHYSRHSKTFADELLCLSTLYWYT